MIFYLKQTKKYPVRVKKYIKQVDEGTQEVYLKATCKYRNKHIFYTEDGSTPTVNSKLYIRPIKVQAGKDYKFTAYATNIIPSILCEGRGMTAEEISAMGQSNYGINWLDGMIFRSTQSSTNQGTIYIQLLLKNAGSTYSTSGLKIFIKGQEVTPPVYMNYGNSKTYPELDNMLDGEESEYSIISLHSNSLANRNGTIRIEYNDVLLAEHEINELPLNDNTAA